MCVCVCVCLCVIFLSCEEKELNKTTGKSLKSGLGLLTVIEIKALSWWLSGSVIWTCFSLVAQIVEICLQCRRPGFDPWLRKIPWRREWQPIPVFLSGKSHGYRSLAGYSPWGHEDLDMTQGLNNNKWR